MYEQFGFTQSVAGNQSFRLLIPDNTVDPSQYQRGGSSRIVDIRLIGDFQTLVNPRSTNWEAGTGLLMTRNPHPNGYLFQLQLPQPLPDGYYQYQYVVRFEDQTVRKIGDPCTKYGGDSDDRSAFVVGGRSVMASPLANRLNPNDLIIYELMIDDFTAEYRAGRAPIDAVIDKLDWLVRLNINAIEFMPWIAWPDDSSFSWGYDPAYFFSVESKYVTDTGNPLDRLSRLANLISECHKRNLHVLLDIVLQHARQGASTNGFPYYWLWQNPTDSPFVGQFVPAPNFSMLPLDYDNQCTQQFITDVCKYWLTRFNLDGYRFDQVTGYDNPQFPQKGAPELVADLRQFTMSQQLSNVSFVLEDDWGFQVISDANNIKPTGAWFDLFRSLPFAIFSGYASTGRVDSAYMRVLNASRDFNSAIAPVIYIENHDHGSVTCRVGSRDRWYKIQPYMIALATCPGVVLVHNGQEWGQFEDIWEDDSNAPPEDKRVNPRPLRWAEAQDQIGHTLRDRYAFLLGIRHDHAGLRSPNFYPDYYDLSWRSFSPQGYGIDEQRQVIIYHRWGNTAQGVLERFMVALNFSDWTQYINIPFPTNGSWTELLNGNNVVNISNYTLLNYRVPSNWGCLFWQVSQ